MGNEEAVDRLLQQRQALLTALEAHQRAFHDKIAEVDRQILALGVAPPEGAARGLTLEERALAIIRTNGQLNHGDLAIQFYGLDSEANRGKAQRVISTLKSKKLIRQIGTAHYEIRDPNEPDPDPAAGASG